MGFDDDGDDDDDVRLFAISPPTVVTPLISVHSSSQLAWLTIKISNLLSPLPAPSPFKKKKERKKGKKRMKKEKKKEEKEKKQLHHATFFFF